jgi:hypothetical protein
MIKNECNEKLHTYSVDNVEEMHQFFERHNLSKLPQE